MAHVAYIGLGSNLGDRQTNIMLAIAALRRDADVLDVQLSSLHETEPEGGPPGQSRFFNAACRVETTRDAHALLELMQTIEQDLGRTREQHWGPRTIDLDLLLFDDEVIDTADLKVPHPLMHQRIFVLAPLAEIAAEVVHPTLKCTINELLRTCR